MKYYYFDKFVTLIKEIKEFHVSKIRLEDGQELYVNSKLLSIKQTYDNAISYIEMIINNMINSISDELKQCGYTWLNYHEYITNSFIKFNGVRLSNGPIEGINSRVKTLKKIYCGYRDKQRFYNRIILIINKKGL